MGRGLTCVHLIATLLRIRIQPLQARVHLMWSYQGLGEPTWVNVEELTPKELEKRVHKLTCLTATTMLEIDPSVVCKSLEYALLVCNGIFSNDCLITGTQRSLESTSPGRRRGASG